MIARSLLLSNTVNSDCFQIIQYLRHILLLDNLNGSSSCTKILNNFVIIDYNKISLSLSTSSGIRNNIIMNITVELLNDMLQTIQNCDVHFSFTHYVLGLAALVKTISALYAPEKSLVTNLSMGIFFYHYMYKKTTRNR